MSSNRSLHSEQRSTSVNDEAPPPVRSPSADGWLVRPAVGMDRAGKRGLWWAAADDSRDELSVCAGGDAA